MDLTHYKTCSTTKTGQTVTGVHSDVKTTKGYLLHLSCVGFTQRRNNQIWKISYAQHQQVCQVHKMMEIMTREVQTKLERCHQQTDSRHTGKDTEKACKSLYPLHDVFVRKVKMLKNSRFELGKLMENPR